MAASPRNWGGAAFCMTSQFFVQRLMDGTWLYVDGREGYDWRKHRGEASAFMGAKAALRNVVSFGLETDVKVFEVRCRTITMRELERQAGGFPEYRMCRCHAVRVMADEAEVMDEYGKRHTLKACER